MPEPEEFLTVAELSRILKLSTRTIYPLLGKEIPAKKFGGSWRIPTWAPAYWSAQCASTPAALAPPAGRS